MLPIILPGLKSLTSIMKAGMKTNITIFDFRAATHLPAWEVVNDDVMGGFSTSQFEALTNNCGVFSGKGVWITKAGLPPFGPRPCGSSLQASPPLSCGCAGMAEATNLLCGPGRVSTPHSTSAVSRQTQARGRNIGWHLAILCPHSVAGCCRTCRC